MLTETTDNLLSFQGVCVCVCVCVCGEQTRLALARALLPPCGSAVDRATAEAALSKDPNVVFPTLDSCRDHVSALRWPILSARRRPPRPAMASLLAGRWLAVCVAFALLARPAFVTGHSPHDVIAGLATDATGDFVCVSVRNTIFASEVCWWKAEV